MSAEDLIISKLDGARDSRSAVQLADVRNLLASLPDVDRAYLDRWIGPARAGRRLSRGCAMNDTPAEVERLYRAMLLARPGAERVKMGGSMLATARALILAGLRDRDPSASPAARRRALFLRLYGADFGDAERERIAARIGRDDGDERAGVSGR